MANRLKMVQKELLYTLFAQNWSIRKINIATGIHRKTITKYLDEWRLLQIEKSQLNDNRPSSDSGKDKGHLCSQSVPPGQNQVPPDQMVHFQVPPDSLAENIPDTSKSKAVSYHAATIKKPPAGQSAKSIFQDLVTEHIYGGSYDSFKRCIRKVVNKHPKLYPHIETLPGEKVQVDFDHGAPTLKNGRYNKPWLFVVTLSSSRKNYRLENVNAKEQKMIDSNTRKP